MNKLSDADTADGVVVYGERNNHKIVSVEAAK